MKVRYTSKRGVKRGVEGCEWRIHAFPLLDGITFQIKTYNPTHSYVTNKKNGEATFDWIAQKLIFVLRNNSEMTSKAMIAETRKYRVEPSKMQLWRAKKKSFQIIEGSYFLSYSKLPKYVQLFRKCNP